jgi:CRP-like cAMP-binding protein
MELSSSATGTTPVRSRSVASISIPCMALTQQLNGFRSTKTGFDDLEPRPVLQPGERTCPAGKPVSNQILLALPDDEFQALRPYLEFVELPQRLRLYEPNAKLEWAYFVNSGMISLVMTTRKGESVEVGVVGNEGFMPLQIAAGVKRNPHLAVVQISGEGFRVGTETLQPLLQSSPSLQAALSRYAAIHGLQVAQTAGCNRLHDLEQRLARWLLLTQDRVNSGLLAITHDFLATMLGTDRPSVSVAAGSLQKKKIIEYTRGAVRILNRKKLEASACECYAAIQQFSGDMALR